ncbi:hypothetical protein [Planctomicrobium sp. SH527]|uniref:hypothetical protein n=1 Tax=Planctomicrobium sp. SH527 TaxID=3448123 RepID=UPI003F5C3EA2
MAKAHVRRSQLIPANSSEQSGEHAFRKVQSLAGGHFKTYEHDEMIDTDMRFTMGDLDEFGIGDLFEISLQRGLIEVEQEMKLIILADQEEQEECFTDLTD